MVTKAEYNAAHKRLRKEKAVSARKIEKLERLTVERGATPAEAESARGKAAALAARSASLRAPWDPPPLPRSVEELLAHRRGPRRAPPASRADDGAEVMQLRAEVKRLRAEVDRLNGLLAQRPEPVTPSNKRYTCEHCGQPLQHASRSDAKYCSTRCRVAAHRMACQS